MNKNLRESMNSGFKEIAKMNKMFERQLDLINKKISVMNKEVSVTNKIFEGKIGNIEGKLNLKEIEIFDGKRKPAVEKGINLEVRICESY